MTCTICSVTLHVDRRSPRTSARVSVRPCSTRRGATSASIDRAISMICRFIDDHAARFRALPAPRRHDPPPPAARARRGSLQRHRAHGHPRRRAVGRVAASRPAQGRRARRRGARGGLRLLPPQRGGAAQRPGAALVAARHAVRRGRATTRRCARTRRGCRKCCGCARRTSRRTATRGSSCPAAAGRPGRARSATCCRRSTSPTSAAATATSRSRPRAGRGRVVGIDRSDAVLERAQELAARRQVDQRAVEEGRPGAPAAARRLGRRRAALAGAAPRQRSRERAWRKPCASCVPAAACWCSICASTTRRWVRDAVRRSAPRLFDARSSRRCCTTPGSPRVRVHVGAKKTGDPFAVLIASGIKPAPGSGLRSRRASAQDPKPEARSLKPHVHRSTRSIVSCPRASCSSTARWAR